MAESTPVLAPGARIVVRNAEWLVRRVDRTSGAGVMLSVVGLSELVRDKDAMFLSDIETSLDVLDPATTRLVQDTTSSYRASLLYIESLLRQTPPTGEDLYVGHRAAMDTLAYQLDPALQTLRQPRQRILIADAVGLGKTLEAGILISELVKRGRGKRILVVAVKSMLTQFQKELWSRFTIPLQRLDSIGIQRVRSRIPTNHNPFQYFDKAIISIDTLKQDSEYRTYLENAYWDIIVIDEAHNVAERDSNSMRSRLAKLLASRSDTLILLSATPHDGRSRSFASLMNMLNPTAISNPEEYGPEDIKGLFIRRFKKDIKDQVAASFKEREIGSVRCVATAEEERAFDILADINLSKNKQRRSGGMLFKTTLEKSLFSSPAACIETVRNRIRNIENREDSKADIEALSELATELKRITPKTFSRYQTLLHLLKEDNQKFSWRASDAKDRLVIFTERIETLKFLQKNLTSDLGLTEQQVAILHGSLSDVDQQKIVEDFGRDDAPVRLLIASDVASEGINLHYLSHRMVHFDIPWSLMVFQQRNGRIDRYGQEKNPMILYLVTESTNTKVRGDMRILERLIEKDEQAVKNIGDTSVLMGVYNVELEEQKTAEAIETGANLDQFEESLQVKPDLLSLLMQGTPPAGELAATRTQSMPSLFRNDFDYLRAALEYIGSDGSIQATYYEEQQLIELTPPDELRTRLQALPSEMRGGDSLLLSSDITAIKSEIKRCREDENAWPTKQYLWELNPVVQWANDKVVSSFGRHEAPVLTLDEKLEVGEVVFLLSGVIPNRKSHPLVHRWFGVRFRKGRFIDVESIERLLERTKLGMQPYPNTGVALDERHLVKMLPAAIEKARLWMSEQREAFNAAMLPRLQEQLDALAELRGRQHKQLEIQFTAPDQKAQRQRTIDSIFDEYRKWITETMETEDNPYIQVVAVLRRG